MSTRLRIFEVVIDTDQGPVRHRFEGALTVLSGPIGAGKSTLFELMKYALGGSARLTPVARTRARSVTVEALFGSKRLKVTRSIDRQTAVAHVEDLDDGDLTGVYEVEFGGEGPTVGQVLMRALGLPPDAMVTSKSRSSRLTFNNVWSFLYVEQREIDRSVAHNTDPYREPARRATFELLFGLTDPRLIQAKAEHQRAAQDLAIQSRDERLILEFLQESQTRNRFDAENLLEELEAQRAQAEMRLRQMQNEDSEVRSRSGVVRELVLETRDRISAMREQQRALEHEQRARQRVISSLEERIANVTRTSVASVLIGQIDFVVCPRCAQSIAGRDIPQAHCTLCLQPEPRADANRERRDAYEIDQLSNQRAEVELLLEAGTAELTNLQSSIDSEVQELDRLEQILDDRSRSFVSPRLEAYADASAQLAVAISQMTEVEKVLRQWDLAADIELRTLELGERVTSLSREIDDITMTLRSVRERLLDALSDDFNEMVHRVGVPGVTSARIDKKSYLPVANDERFDRLSTGGITTALVWTYWLTVLATALRERQTLYPTLLIIDTPRKSIGADNTRLVAAMYDQIAILAESYPDRLQVIVADNDAPGDLGTQWQEWRFDYENPTISTIPHPGIIEEQSTVDSMD